MTNYEKIKQACFKANPKLLELSLGCEVKDTMGQSFTITHRHKLPNDKPCWGAINWKHGTLIMDDEIKEILGHEPQLSDVLLALRQVREKIEGKLFVSDIGEFVIAKIGHSIDTECYYDLTKPLKDQSAKTLRFIADLL